VDNSPPVARERFLRSVASSKLRIKNDGPTQDAEHPPLCMCVNVMLQAILSYRVMPVKPREAARSRQLFMLHWICFAVHTRWFGGSTPHFIQNSRILAQYVITGVSLGVPLY
jgi:hypothetical protein